MGILDILKNKSNITKEDKKMQEEEAQKKELQEQVEIVKTVYNNIDEEKEAEEVAKNRVIQIINDNPEISTISFFEMIKEDEDIPMRVVVEAIKLLPEIESEKAAVKVVQKLDLSTKHVEEII